MSATITRTRDPLERLTRRERQVLALMAEGRSNPGIARSLFVTDKAIEKHVGNIFTKLDLMPTKEDHRRVIAVLQWVATTGRDDRAGPSQRRARSGRMCEQVRNPVRRGGHDVAMVADLALVGRLGAADQGPAIVTTGP